jgi:lipid-A-disaccharide synthase-like uncharacterized protein
MDKFWLYLGFVGQFFFSARFLVQWLATEKQKKSVVPVSFWYFSILGSTLLLAYAIYKKDPVFILGQSFGMIVYFRNLQIIFKKENKELEPN